MNEEERLEAERQFRIQQGVAQLHAQAQARADLNELAEQARFRALLSFIFAALGGIAGLIGGISVIASGVERQSVVGVLIGIGATVVLVIVGAYVGWAWLWGWVVTWGWWRRLTAGWGCFGSLTFMLIILALFFYIPLTIAFYYGVLGGAIYQWRKAKRLNTADLRAREDEQIHEQTMLSGGANQPQIDSGATSSPIASSAGAAPQTAVAAPPVVQQPTSRRSPLQWVLVGIGVLLLLGCVFSLGAASVYGLLAGRSSPTPSPSIPGDLTPIPSSQPTQEGPAPTIIYQNTLTAPASEWEPDQACFFASDGFHVKPNLACQSPVRGRADVDVSVKMRQISGTPTDQNGIEVRRSGDPASLYEFDIDATGGWLFKKCIGSFDNCDILTSGNALAIQTGLGAVNTVEVRAVGSHFVLLVNGTQVGQVDDASLAAGDVWLDTGGSAECVFTDFIAIQPT